jgi:hypothetical protein
MRKKRKSKMKKFLYLSHTGTRIYMVLRGNKPRTYIMTDRDEEQ